MEIQEMQSMDWLFKKERIYLLAQFWQQVRYFPPDTFNIMICFIYFTNHSADN